MPFEAALLALAANGNDSSSTTTLPVVVTTYDTPCYAYPYAYYGYYDYGYYDYPYGYYNTGYYPGYYYYPAMAESGASQQLAVMPQAPSVPGAQSSPVKANPGHLLTCGQAILLGGAMAACDLLSGKSDMAGFPQDFQSKATAAAVRQ